MGPRRPGALLASGRDADIFEYGPSLVLRRSRAQRSLVLEARTMEHVRQHGYPAPAVESVSDDGTELVMERLEGPSMFGLLERRPWRLRACAAMLADLHAALHGLSAPEWLPPGPGPAGRSVLHLDLHPLNVMMTRAGPIVIDWTNAAAGDASADVALTWILMAAADIPAPPLQAVLLQRFRAGFVGSFLRHFDLVAVRACLEAVVAWKVTDPHMSQSEQAAMWEVVRRALS